METISVKMLILVQNTTTFMVKNLTNFYRNLNSELLQK